jgi:hypothetical protein
LASTPQGGGGQGLGRLLAGLDRVVRTHAELVGQALDQGLDGGRLEAVLVGELVKALVEVVEDLLGVVVLVLVPEHALEMAAHAGAVEGRGALLLPLIGHALGLGLTGPLDGQGRLLAVEALLVGEGLAQVAAEAVEGARGALELRSVLRLQHLRPRRLDPLQAHLGDARQRRVDMLGREHGRGG